MRKIRVLVVEDSLTVRKRLVEVLSSDPECEVVGEASDGQAAITLCERLRPDVITLDMVLPKLDGVAVTEHIMAFTPTPIVIVSASYNRGEVTSTLDALAAGAVDVLEKPDGRVDPDDAWSRHFLATVKLASRIKVITHVRGRLRGSIPTPPPPSMTSRTSGPPFVAAPEWDGRFRLIAMGASTGGPAAVVTILRSLPKSFPLPVLLVLHIGKPFGEGFAEWLGHQLHMPVAQATDGEPLPRPGRARVILARPDRHLVLREGRLRLTADAERHSCRPSVDVLFESVARETGPGAIGCLLTGMGRDGAEGLLAMKRAGAFTLAQDEASSVVFGMPREAIRLGAADRVLPLSEFDETLAVLARHPEPRKERGL
ncbi:MAG TPA: chemotaxis-specific protein-glutamate methyltransferase CheB [Polyangiaceae bacterium]|jgi:two-component system chemotaxis response regulator CheB|nr:chemotaxis-specific protein-glutamate methyltransferase CheB [Polyangiaceae bacterium]